MKTLLLLSALVGWNVIGASGPGLKIPVTLDAVQAGRPDDPSNAFGFGVMTLDSWNPYLFSTSIEYSGLVGEYLDAHLHLDFPGETGSIWLANQARGPHAGRLFATNVWLELWAINGLRHGWWYVDIHTTAWPEGELHGETANGGPNPLHLDTGISADADLSWYVAPVPGRTVTNEVYFGTNPVPGPAEYAGTTTNQAWPLPRLAPATTYYWQIVSTAPGYRPGPVWQFTTRGLDHFEWDFGGSTASVGVPMAATVRAVDEFGRTVTNYGGVPTLAAFTNRVPAILADDFEDGDAQGWETCPVDPVEWDTYWQEYSLAVTNVPGSGGRSCLSIIGEPWECDNGVWQHFETNEFLAERLTFRIRASTTNATGGMVQMTVAQDDEVRFGMWADGTMGVEDGGRRDDGGQFSPRLPYEANRWYQVTLVFKPEFVQELQWDDDPIWPILVEYTLIWMDFYLDDQLIVAHVNVGKDPTRPASIGIENWNYTEIWLDDIELRGPTVADPIPVQPSGPVQFTDGVWSGYVTLSQPASGLYLTVDDGLQHAGTNSPITVLPFAFLPVARSGNVVTLGWSACHGWYQLQQSTNLASGSWENLGGPTAATTVTLSTTNRAAFFRLQCLISAP